MPHTPHRPVDVAALFRELAGQERTTVRLHPRPGRVGPQDSSIGGPLLWPDTEPWPQCDYPGHATIPPMVAVAQLYARDVPGLPVPPGADVCQVLWCPTWDHDPDYVPRIEVRWRDSGRDPGMGGGLATAPPVDPVTADEDFIPNLCSVSPEQTIDYPDWSELSEELRQHIEAWEQDSGWSYAYHLGAAPGTKVGGWPEWMQDPEWPTCPRGHPMDHLLTIASWEYDAESQRTWKPPDLADGDAGLTLGDAGDVYIFICVTCDDRPIASLLQAS
jgi:hypothetical protein